MGQVQRFALAVALFCMWAGLVYAGLVPIGPFADFLRDSLVSLGVFHATLTNPGGPGGPPAAQ